MLKAHHPDLCAVCSKKGGNAKACDHNEVPESRYQKYEPAVRMVPSKPKDTKSYETLKGMAAILESEYREAAQ